MSRRRSKLAGLVCLLVAETAAAVSSQALSIPATPVTPLLTPVSQDRWIDTSVELLDGNLGSLFVEGPAGPNAHPIDRTGSLPPGEYVLRVSASAAGSGPGWASDASFDLTFDVAPLRVHTFHAVR